MITGLTWLATSGGLLIVFGLLFHIESIRGDRILLSRVRNWLDTLVAKLYFRLTHVSIHVGAGAIRIIFHYFAHRFLSFVIWTLRLLESYIARLQIRNRKVVRSVREEQTKTHLDLLAEHQAQTTLTEAQKRKLKEKSIEG